MKTTRHSLLAKGLMVLLALLIMVFAFTYSWYTSEPKVDASGISASIESTGDFEYAIGFYNNGTAGSYKATAFTKDSSALNLESLKVYDGTSDNKDGQDAGGYYHNYNLLHDYKPIDVTGDGRTLIRPAMQYGNKEINMSSLDYSIAEPNTQYISFDLYFRSKSTGVSIKLGDGSWAKGGCEVTSGGSMTGANATNKSTYGDFSRDAIVGAVRIAFVPYDYSTDLGNIPATLADYQQNTPEFLHNYAMNETGALVWLPRPDLHIVEPANGGLTGWTLTTNSTAADDKVHKYYNIFNCQPAKTAAEGGYASNNTKYHTTEAHNNTITPENLTAASQEFTTISNAVKIGDYYYTKVNVRIWVEGTDLEARRATSGGQFEVNFKFTTT